MAFANGTVLTSIGKAVVANIVAGVNTTALPKYLAIGTGATTAGGPGRTAAVGDLSLTTEVETRATCTLSTVTTTNPNDTFKAVGTVTATTSRTVDECMTNTNASGTSNNTATGVGIFVSATLSPTVGLNTGDSVQITTQVQFT